MGGAGGAGPGVGAPGSLRGEEQTPWGPKPPPSTVKRPDVDLERPLAFQTRHGLAV